MPDETIPEAQRGEDALPTALELELGPPFAMAAGCDVTEAWAHVKCDQCSNRFKVNLLKAGYVQCPGADCGAEYTYALLVGNADDTGMAGDLLGHLFEHNRITPDDMRAALVQLEHEQQREPNPGDDPEDSEDPEPDLDDTGEDEDEDEGDDGDEGDEDGSE